ncbi:lipopolysaccharide biosynthesis protein [Parapedobacter deserti]|uniref:Lipopolysaccharide biosynthesis protein n=1 Tax=Parapedobacter deserti TaxID=1912957 RepID=A0ABV7JG89_9SPHI
MIKNILKSDFNRNFATLFSGSVLAQIVPLLASVFLVRLFTPEDFGILAIFNAMVFVFVSAINLRYEFAIPLPKEDADAISLAFLSMIVAFAVSLLLFVVFILFKQPILILIGGDGLGSWLYLVPFAAFLGGLYNALNYFSLRFKKYKTIAGSNIIRSVSNAGLQLGFGLAGINYVGLILGSFFSALFGNYKMIRHFMSHRSEFKKVTRSTIVQNAKRYKKFPLISVWGILINNLSVNINTFFISNLYGIKQLGYYSYGYRYLNVPLSLISNNMGQLFYQICADRYKEGKAASKEFLSTLKKLLIICMPVFTVLFFVIEDLFALMFGEAWRVAGTYSKILLPLFFIRTVYGPLSLVTGAFEKQGLALILQIVLFSANIVSFTISYVYKFSISHFLFLYMSLGSVVYSCLLLVLYLVSKKLL